MRYESDVKASSSPPATTICTPLTRQTFLTDASSQRRDKHSRSRPSTFRASTAPKTPSSRSRDMNRGCDVNEKEAGTVNDSAEQRSTPHRLQSIIHFLSSNLSTFAVAVPLFYLLCSSAHRPFFSPCLALHPHPTSHLLSSRLPSHPRPAPYQPTTSSKASRSTSNAPLSPYPCACKLSQHGLTSRGYISGRHARPGLALIEGHVRAMAAASLSVCVLLLRG